MIRRVLSFAAIAAVLAGCAGDALAPDSPSSADQALSLDRGSERSAVIFVTTEADAGPGSFRAALEAANANPRIRSIRFKHGVRHVATAAELSYTGAQDLSVEGDDAVVDASGAGGNGLVATGGGSLDITRLTIQNAPGNGLVLTVPAGATGVVSLTLDRFAARGNGLYGVLMDDQAPEQDTHAPTGSDSDAGIYFELRRSVIEDNGKSGPSDFDGARVQEGGNGSIVARIIDSRIALNGADGVEYDERGEGNVEFEVLHSTFVQNGPQDPNDLDDGFDIDEIGGGDVRGRMIDVDLDRNFDQGIDFDESDGGSVHLTLVDVRTRGNGLEGIKVSEDGNGDVQVFGNRVISANSATEEGAVYEEEGEGDISVRLVQATFSGNAKENLEITEADEGSIFARLTQVTAVGSVGDEGILIEETDGGSVDAALTRVTSNGNTKEGLEIAQETAGADTGSLVLRRVNLDGNTGGPLTAEGVTVTTMP
ncbi:MAG: hypothetical protein AB7L66_18170 [Gemmatimonadales bacterium]